MPDHWSSEMNFEQGKVLSWETRARDAYHQLSRGKVITDLVSERLEIRRVHGLSPVAAARGVVLQAAQELGIG